MAKPETNDETASVRITTLRLPSNRKAHLLLRRVSTNPGLPVAPVVDNETFSPGAVVTIINRVIRQLVLTTLLWVHLHGCLRLLRPQTKMIPPSRMGTLRVRS